MSKRKKLLDVGKSARGHVLTGIGLAFVIAVALLAVTLVGFSGMGQAAPLLATPTLDVSAVSQFGNDTLALGELITYFIELESDEDTPSFGGVLTYTLPTAMQIQSYAYQGVTGTDRANVITWTLPQMLAREVRHFTITAQVPMAQVVLKDPLICVAEAEFIGANTATPVTYTDHPFGVGPGIGEAHTTAISETVASVLVNDQANEVVAGEVVTLSFYFTLPKGTTAYSLTPKIVLQDGLRPYSATPGIVDMMPITEDLAGFLPGLGFDGTQVTLAAETVTDTDSLTQTRVYTIYARRTQYSFAIPGAPIEEIGDEDLDVYPYFEWCNAEDCDTLNIKLSDAKAKAEMADPPVEAIRPKASTRISYAYIDGPVVGGDPVGQGGGRVRFEIETTPGRQSPTAYDVVVVAKLPSLGFDAAASTPDYPSVWATVGNTTIVTWTGPVTFPHNYDAVFGQDWVAVVTATLPTSFNIGTRFPVTSYVHYETLEADPVDEGRYVVGGGGGIGDRSSTTLEPGVGHTKVGGPDVKIGDRVYYTLTTKLGADIEMFAPWYTDTLPLGFHYVSGTLQVQGATMTGWFTGSASVDAGDPVPEILVWKMQDVSASGPVVFTATYVAEVTGLSVDGQIVNTKLGRDTARNSALLTWLSAPDGERMTFADTLPPVVGSVNVIQPQMANLTANRPGVQETYEVGEWPYLELSFENTGYADAYELQVCDIFPEGITYFSDTQKFDNYTWPAGCSPTVIEKPQSGDDGTICWTLDVACAGGDFMIGYYVNVGREARPGFWLSNDFFVEDFTSQPGGDGYGDLPADVTVDRHYKDIPGALPASASCPAPGCFKVVGLAAEKTAAKVNVKAGDTLTYTIAITDAHPDTDYTQLVLTDTYDANMVYVEATPEPDDIDTNARQLIWEYASLPTAGSEWITLTMRIIDALAGDVAAVDNVLQWDSAQTVPYVLTETTTAGVAVLNVAISGPDQVEAGETRVYYTVVYSNTGTGTLPVTLTVDYDEDYLILQSATIGREDVTPLAGSKVITDPTPLPPYDPDDEDTQRELELEFDVRDRLPPDRREFETPVLIESVGAEPKQDSWTTEVLGPILTLEKIGPDSTRGLPDDVIRYQIRVVNTGNSTVTTQMTFTDTWDSNTDYNATGLGWTRLPGNDYAVHQPVGEELGIGEAYTVEFQVKVNTEALFFTNVVSFSTGQTTLQYDVEHTWQPSIETWKASDPEIAFPVRDTLVYTVGYYHTGQSNASLVRITDTLPTGFDYEGRTIDGAGCLDGTGSPTDWDFNISGQDAVWSCVTLEDGAQGQFQIWGKVQANRDGEVLTNTTYSYIDGEFVRPIEEPLLTRVARPRLGVKKDAYPPYEHPVAPEDVITYTLVYSTHDGTAASTNPAYDVVIRDTLPSEVAYVRCMGADTCGGIAATGEVSWTFAEIPTDTRDSVMVVAEVKAGTAGESAVNADYTIESNLLTTGETYNGPDVTTRIWAPHLSLAKAAEPDWVDASNQPITYTLTYTNDGGGRLTNVVITDVLSTLTLYDRVSAPSGFKCSTSGPNLGKTVTCRVDKLEQGESGTIQIYVFNAASGSENVEIPNTAEGISDQTDLMQSDKASVWYRGSDKPFGLDFTYTPAAPQAREVITFVGSVMFEEITTYTYTWDFGDTLTGTGKTTTHIYQVADTYTVTMSVSNDVGTTDYSEAVVVSGAPEIAVDPTMFDVVRRKSDGVLAETLTISNTGTDALHVMTVTASPTATWLTLAPISMTVDPGSDQDVAVTFDPSGLVSEEVYTTTILVQSDAANQPLVQVPVTLTVGGVPVMVVTHEPMSVTLTEGDPAASRNVTISNTGEVTLTWSITRPTADAAWLNVSATGQQETAPGGATSVTVTLGTSTVGGYTSALTIDSNDPVTSQKTIPVTLTVKAEEPVCEPVAGLSFAFAPSQPQVDETVYFTASVTGGDTPISYAWDFGDDGTGTGGTITHTYSMSMTYTVMLTATNGCEPPGTDSAQVPVVEVTKGGKVYLPLVLKQ